MCLITKKRKYFLLESKRLWVTDIATTCTNMDGKFTRRDYPRLGVNVPYTKFSFTKFKYKLLLFTGFDVNLLEAAQLLRWFSGGFREWNIGLSYFSTIDTSGVCYFNWRGNRDFVTITLSSKRNLGIVELGIWKAKTECK